MAQGRDAAYATASKVMVDNLALRDGQEGIRAFIEKRKPVWSNKAEKAHDWRTVEITTVGRDYRDGPTCSAVAGPNLFASVPSHLMGYATF